MEEDNEGKSFLSSLVSILIAIFTIGFIQGISRVRDD
jgi:hypothetical protein